MRRPAGTPRALLCCVRARLFWHRDDIPEATTKMTTVWRGGFRSSPAHTTQRPHIVCCFARARERSASAVFACARSLNTSLIIDHRARVCCSRGGGFSKGWSTGGG